MSKIGIFLSEIYLRPGLYSHSLFIFMFNSRYNKNIPISIKETQSCHYWSMVFSYDTFMDNWDPFKHEGFPPPNPTFGGRQGKTILCWISYEYSINYPKHKVHILFYYKFILVLIWLSCHTTQPPVITRFYCLVSRVKRTQCKNICTWIETE